MRLCVCMCIPHETTHFLVICAHYAIFQRCFFFLSLSIQLFNKLVSAFFAFLFFVWTFEHLKSIEFSFALQNWNSMQQTTDYYSFDIKQRQKGRKTKIEQTNNRILCGQYRLCVYALLRRRKYKKD